MPSPLTMMQKVKQVGSLSAFTHLSREAGSEHRVLSGTGTAEMVLGFKENALKMLSQSGYSRKLYPDR